MAENYLIWDEDEEDACSKTDYNHTAAAPTICPRPPPHHLYRWAELSSWVLTITQPTKLAHIPREILCWFERIVTKTCLSVTLHTRSMSLNCSLKDIGLSCTTIISHFRKFEFIVVTSFTANHLQYYQHLQQSRAQGSSSNGGCWATVLVQSAKLALD